MLRRILILIVIGTPMLADAPARAGTTQVGLTATSSSPLLEGERLTVTGQGRGLQAGDVVTLQRRRASEWVTVDRGRLSRRSTYALHHAPRRGLHAYRVVAPGTAQHARVASRVLDVVVNWRPEISIAAVSEPAPGGERYVALSGSTSVRRRVGVELEWRQAGLPWTSWGKARSIDGSFAATSDQQFGPDTELRAVIPASGLRLRAAARIMAPQYAPFDVAVNDPAGVRVRVPGSIQVRFQAKQDDFVSITGRGLLDSDFGAVIGPEGAVVPTDVRDRVEHFTAPLAGTYTATLRVDYTPNDIWVSTPKVIDGQLDAAPIELAGDLPGQPLDVSLHVAVPSLVRFGGAGSWTGPTGASVSPWLEAEQLYRLEVGTYRARFWDAWPSLGEWQASSVEEVPTLVDSPPVDVAERVTVLKLASDGTPFDIGFSGDPRPLVYGPDLQATSRHQPSPAVGDYYVVTRSAGAVSASSPLDDGDVTVDGPSKTVDTEGALARSIFMAATLTGGTYVTMDLTTSAGWFDGSRLIDESGAEVPWNGFRKRTWLVPADGTYRFHLRTSGGWVGSVSLRSSEVMTLTLDTPLTVPLNSAGEVVIVRLVAPTETVLSVTIDQVELPAGWDVDLFSPNGHWYNSFNAPGVMPPFTVREGEVDIYVTAPDDATGSLRLQASAPFGH